MNNTVGISGITLSKDEFVVLREKIEKASDSNRRVYWFVKRIFDIIMSSVAILILSPVFLIVALAIYIDDPKGSPFFVQTRVGRHGKKFKFYKFRSMVSNAEELLEQLKEKNEKDGPVFKMKDDPRITRVGKFIRKTSIDELPQLFNILKEHIKRRYVNSRSTTISSEGSRSV